MNLLLKDDFWNYSLKLYGTPAVKEACLFLQNHFKLNVNLLLFCCWFADQHGGPITPAKFKFVLNASEDWHTHITKKLRKLRLRLSQHSQINWVKDVYLDALSCELMAEKIEQVFIMNPLPLTQNKRRSIQQRAKDALRNLHAYYTLSRITLDHSGYTATQTLLTEAFPQIAESDLPQLSLPL